MTLDYDRIYLLSFKSWVFSVIQAGVHTSSVRSLRYGWWAYALGERTTPRLGEKSKIITVDGNLASGKGALAQKLADKLGNCPTLGILLVFAPPLEQFNNPSGP